MEKRDTVTVGGVSIKYFLSDKTVHIDNNESLKSVIPNPKAAIQLARKLKENYQKIYGSELSVSELSMAIEIYGHIYPEKIAKTIKTLPLPDFVDKAMDELIKKTDIIDSGEESIDQNRKIWDAIAKVIPV
jgi:hypothetical protein